MPTTYYQRDTTRAVGNRTSEHERALETSTATSATITSTVAATALSYDGFCFTATSGGGATDWPSGTYGTSYDVTAAGASLTYEFTVRRVSADYATTRESLFFGSVSSGVGIKTTSPSGSFFNTSGSRASTDVVQTGLILANSNMMSSEALTLRVNTADSYVLAPWGGAAATDRPTARHSYMPAVHRAAVW